MCAGGGNKKVSGINIRLTEPNVVKAYVSERYLRSDSRLLRPPLQILTSFPVDESIGSPRLTVGAYCFITISVVTFLFHLKLSVSKKLQITRRVAKGRGEH